MYTHAQDVNKLTDHLQTTQLLSKQINREGLITGGTISPKRFRTNAVTTTIGAEHQLRKLLLYSLKKHYCSGDATG